MKSIDHALLCIAAGLLSMVLATGGGLVMSPDSLASLRRSAVTIWLKAAPEDHWNRVVRQGDRRPMADHPQAMAELRRLLAAREPLYATADHTVDTSRLDAASVARTVASPTEGFPSMSPPTHEPKRTSVCGTCGAWAP